MKYTKRKGNALLTVVGMFAIMSILIVTMINGTMASHQLTRNANNRIETFYSADSGLEIAYNEILSVIKNAIDSGYAEVERLKAAGGGINTEQKLVNIGEEGWDNKVFQTTYKKYLKDNIEIAIDNVTHNSIIYDEFNRDEQVVQVAAQLHEEIQNEKKELLPVNLKATFTDEDDKSRAVEVDYDIEVPDYGIKEVLEEVSGNDNIFDYIFAADGNLDIELDSSFNVLGDMWVKGEELRDINDPLSSGILIRDKGINSTLTWHGDIATNGTFDIQNANLSIPNNNNRDSTDPNVEMGYNIYANDFRYVGNPEKKRDLFNPIPLEDEYTNPSNEGLNLHVYNDFIFDGTNTDINMKNFYGLNDITDASGINNDGKPKVASSMIIESEDFGKDSANNLASSKINIASDTMILGTAYLNLSETPLSKNEFFKTGESIVINRHSSPYTYRGYTEEKYLYKYKNNLHMIDKLYKDGEYQDLKIHEKVNIVEEFYNSQIKDTNKENEIEGLAKGMNLNSNKIYTAGVVYNNGKLVNLKNYTMSRSIEGKRKEFAREVYFMGDAKASVTEEDFSKQNVETTVVNNFNWNAIRKIVESGHIYDTDKKTILFERENNEHNLSNGGAIFKGISTKTLATTILGRPIGIFPAEDKINIIFNYSDNELVLRHNQPFSIEEKEEKKIYINLDKVHNHNMTPTLVISKGPVTVERIKGAGGSGNMEFTALVYSASNLKFDINDGPCNVGNYSPIDTNLNELFKKFFAEGGLGDLVLGDIIGGTTSESIEKIVNAEDLIKKGNWKLNK
ncbi:pilus assembly PilX N-terminal domain-containing protein [uncultured Clostridium sp.]|uniref:pilus assembly PilX N-terminal domain-containing protein n=1 Tax=uncultured Clostridium sp. TaxID=59620 RepID=UPI00262C94A3|nr:pilus assembly PilX N-terminal domain-containing protein [uncultured Clostridium sp.]